ncbi:MAG TPA: IclR family transcriptional regulator C-terminal domain-containing protein [Rubrobacteraceae bacterium]|nr:IclR family transcriptional regulator C-terminal domain-containing protein [Rubrobacteraceae bacterium]
MAHCAAIGKALLAGLTDEQIERLLPERLPAETPNTITGRTDLLADFERVRTRGVAYDREEFTIGISWRGNLRRWRRPRGAHVSPRLRHGSPVRRHA